MFVAVDALVTLTEHTNGVYSLIVLSNDLLASGSGDKTIIIWNIKSEYKMNTLIGHTDWVRSLAVLPDGYLASGSDDKTIKIWNRSVLPAFPPQSSVFQEQF